MGAGATRQARALWLSNAEYRNRSKFHRTQTISMDPARAEHSRYWLEKWDTTIQELSQVRAALPTIEDTTTTKQIERVAAEQFAPDEDGHAQLVGAWQSMSSSAHGMSWGLFVRPGMHRVSGPPRGPLVPFMAKPGTDDPADMLVLCARLAGQAGVLLQDRADG